MSIGREGGIPGDPFEGFPERYDPNKEVEGILSESAESEDLSIPNEVLRGMDEKRLSYYLGQKFYDLDIPPLEGATVDDIPYFGQRMKSLPEERQREAMERWYINMGLPLRRIDVVKDEDELDRRIEDLAGRLGYPIPQNETEVIAVENIGHYVGLRNDYGEWENFWQINSFVTNEQGTFLICGRTFGESADRLVPVDKISEYQRVHDLLIDRKYNTLRNFAEERDI